MDVVEYKTSLGRAMDSLRIDCAPMNIAVCICTCNRPQHLDRLLGVLADMETAGINGDIFIQIVDNAPDGSARAVYDLHRSSLPIKAYFAEEQERGISFARNRAISEALRRHAEFVSFIDDDDLPHTDWLKSLVAVQRETNSQLVFGLYDPPQNPLPDWMREIKLYRKPTIEGLNRFGFPLWAATRNVLLRRDLLEAMAAEEGILFCLEFALTGSEDTDFFIRAVKRGARYAIAPKSIVKLGLNPDRMTLRGVLRFAYRLGVSGVMLDRRHKAPRQYKKDRLRRILSSPKVLIPLLRVPFLSYRRYPSALAACLYDIARRLGELSAFMGKRFHYYR